MADVIRRGAFAHRIDPAHRFDLDYLVDNGKLSGWETDYERGCVLIKWDSEDEEYSVLDADNDVIGGGDTIQDALKDARCYLTDRRRARDGIVTARVC